MKTKFKKLIFFFQVFTRNKLREELKKWLYTKMVASGG